jgi:hypothetical protein
MYDTTFAAILLIMQTAENPQLRAYYGMTSDQTGIVVRKVLSLIITHKSDTSPYQSGAAVAAWRRADCH